MNATRLTPAALARLDSTRYPSIEAAIEGAGLNWPVEKHPLFVRLPGEDMPEVGSFKRADNFFGITRMDTKKVLGVGSKRYAAIDNATALAPMQPLIDEGGFQIQGAGALNGGAQVWLKASLPPIQVAGHSMDHSVFARFRHDGKGGVRYINSFIRKTCWNQLRGLLAAGRHLLKGMNLGFMHTESGLVGVRSADLDFAAILEVRERFLDLAEGFLATPFSKGEMEKLARMLLPRPAEDATPRALKGWNERFESLMTTAYGAPDLDDVRLTEWGAINAVADFEQHLVRVTGTAEKQEETLFARSLEAGSLVQKAEAYLRGRR